MTVHTAAEQASALMLDHFHSNLANTAWNEIGT